jgi:hypothetical protein
MKDELKAQLPEDLAKILEDAKISDEAVQILIDQELTTVTALQGFTYKDLLDLKIKPGPAKMLERLFKEVPVVEPVAPVDTPASFEILPDLPDETLLTQQLQVGGILNIEPVDVMAAVHAAIAEKIGFYDLPDRLAEKIVETAEKQSLPIGENYIRLSNMLTKRGYGELFTALGGAGNFVSDAKKKQILKRINTILWPALYSFHQQLVAWGESWNTGVNTNALLYGLLSGGRSGAGTVLPPGVGKPPDTSALRDAASAFIDEINKIFSGFGILVSRALAYEAQRVVEILNDPALPAATGAINKEQMLRDLGVTVGANYPRLERSVTQYTLAIMKLAEVNPGNTEYAYLVAMSDLGATIPWDKLQESLPRKFRVVDDKKGDNGPGFSSY